MPAIGASASNRSLNYYSQYQAGAAVVGHTCPNYFSEQIPYQVINDSYGIRLVYTNEFADVVHNIPNVPNTNAITVKARVFIPTPNGTFPWFWVTWGGSGNQINSDAWGNEQVVIFPGGFAISDPINYRVPAGTQLIVESTVSVAQAGMYIPLTQKPITNDLTGWYAADMGDIGNLNDTTCFVGGDPIAFLQTGAYGVATGSVGDFGPKAIIAQPVNPNGTRVLVIGDSIWYGSKVSPPSTGYDESLWGTVFQQKFPYLYCCINGDSVMRISGYYDDPSNAHRRITSERMRRLWAGYSHCVVLLGTNDIGQSLAWNASTLEAAFQSIYDTLAGMGNTVYACTIPPVAPDVADGGRSTGFTSYATQFPTTNDSIRQAVNTWIRSMPSDVAGVIDFASVLEYQSSPGVYTGKWVVNSDGSANTTDGLHPIFVQGGAGDIGQPVTAGRALAQTAIDVSKFFQ